MGHISTSQPRGHLNKPVHALNTYLFVQDKSVQLFRAFAPMLCKRPTDKVEETVKEMQGRKFIIEEKLDGERMQLHKRGNEYFYCSRYCIMTTLRQNASYIIRIKERGRTIPICTDNMSALAA